MEFKSEAEFEKWLKQLDNKDARDKIETKLGRTSEPKPEQTVETVIIEKPKWPHAPKKPKPIVEEPAKKTWPSEPVKELDKTIAPPAREKAPENKAMMMSRDAPKRETIYNEGPASGAVLDAEKIRRQ